MASDSSVATQTSTTFDERSTMTVDRGDIASALLDTRTIAFYISGSAQPFYHLPEGLFTGLAPELMNSSAQDPILTSEDAFCILVVWLIYRDLDNVTAWCWTWVNQHTFAEAWSLEARYHIPEFQNEVMHMFMLNLESESVDAGTVEEAYRTAKRDTKLQQACVAHIVGEGWDKGCYTQWGLEKIPGFCLDVAVQFGALDKTTTSSDKLLDISNFMVDENGEDDESVTEG